MLFGACNCTPAAAGLSRRGLLCAGGAGFVTALIGTLIGSGRTAHAKTLTGPVPEVDRLNVTIVDDIMVRRNVATQKLDGLTVERAQPNEVPEKAPRATLVADLSSFEVGILVLFFFDNCLPLIINLIQHLSFDSPNFFSHYKNLERLALRISV